MSVSVCLSVCVFVCLSVRDHIFRTAYPIFANFFVHAIYARGSVLLWRRTDTLCTSGLWMTSYLLISQGCSTSEVRPAEAQCTRSLGLGYKLRAVIAVAEKLTHGTTFRALKVTSQVATPGSESAVCDCFVVVVVVLHYSNQMLLDDIDNVAEVCAPLIAL